MRLPTVTGKLPTRCVKHLHICAARLALRCLRGASSSTTKTFDFGKDTTSSSSSTSYETLDFSLDGANAMAAGCGDDIVCIWDVMVAKRQTPCCPLLQVVGGTAEAAAVNEAAEVSSSTPSVGFNAGRCRLRALQELPLAW
jgi:hypothetical protein